MHSKPVPILVICQLIGVKVEREGITRHRSQMEIYRNWSFDNRSPLHWINQIGRMVACMLFACLPWPVLISLDQCWLILILILDLRLWSVFARCFPVFDVVFSGTCLPFLCQIHADTISGKKEIYVRSTVSCCNKMVARKKYLVFFSIDQSQRRVIKRRQQQDGKKNILVLLDIWPSSFYSVCYYRADTQNDYKCK